MMSACENSCWPRLVDTGNKVIIRDEATGNDEPNRVARLHNGSRQRADSSQQRQLGWLKQLYGEWYNALVQRCKQRDDGQVVKTEDWITMVCGGIMNTNLAKEPETAIRSRLIYLGKQIFGGNTDAARKDRRADLHKDEIFNRSTVQSLSVAAEEKNLLWWRMQHAIIVLYESLRSSGLIDLGEQHSAMAELIEKTVPDLDARSKAKVLGMANGFDTVLRVTMALFTQAGFHNICESMEYELKPNPKHRHAVAEHCRKVLSAASAPFADPVVHALGLLTGKEFLTSDENVVTVVLCGLAKMKHFSVRNLINSYEDTALMLMATEGDEKAKDVCKVFVDALDEDAMPSNVKTLRDDEQFLECLRVLLQQCRQLVPPTIEFKAQGVVETYYNSRSSKYQKRLYTLKRNAAKDKLDEIARSARYLPTPSWRPECREGDYTNFGMLNCGSARSALRTLEEKGMPRQIAQITLSKMHNSTHTGPERCGVMNSGSGGNFDFSQEREAAWDGDGRNTSTIVISEAYNPKDKERVLIMSASHAFHVLENLMFNEQVESLLGPFMKQEIPENVSQLELDLAAYDDLRNRVCKHIRRGPTGSAVLDGTTPRTSNHGQFPPFPGTFFPEYCQQSEVPSEMDTTESSAKKEKTKAYHTGEWDGYRHVLKSVDRCGLVCALHSKWKRGRRHRRICKLNLRLLSRLSARSAQHPVHLMLQRVYKRYLRSDTGTVAETEDGDTNKCS